MSRIGFRVEAMQQQRGQTPSLFRLSKNPCTKNQKKTALPVFFRVPGAGPDVRGAEGGETENFCPVPRKGQKISVDRTLDRRDTGHAAAEGRRKNHIFSACLQFLHSKQSFFDKQ